MAKMTILEGNSNDKDNVKAYMVKGEPGVSPTIDVSKEDGVTTLTIEDAEGTHTATIADGDDLVGGVPTDGVIGFDGEATDIPDGYEVLDDINLVKSFNTIAEMKAAETLQAGDTCQTLGYYEENDGGKRLYKIRNITEQDTIDETFLINLNNNSLVAELVTTNEFDKYNYYNMQKGVFQNKQQKIYTTYGDFIDFGEPNEPPLLDSIKNKGFDIIAHFYNDFGLKSTALEPNQGHGSWKWYDWSWNFPNVSDYDESRVPLLGYYQGDDRKTLDWILYWLGKSGVNVLSLVKPSGINMTNWQNEENVNYWLYVLMNMCKNIKSFKILPWIRSGGGSDTSEIYETYKQYFIDFITTYKNNIYSYNLNGKNYLCAYIWDFESMRGVLDNYNGYSNTIQFFKDFASSIKNLGFDGLNLICRNYGFNFEYKYINDGLIFMKGDYSSVNNATGTYEDYANSEFTIIDNLTVLNVNTSHYSADIHPSNFNLPGSTPQLFSKILNKAIQTMIKNNLPKIITINNVSEWAESGAGLIPNIKDGFGYLDAVEGCQTILNNIDTEKLMNDTKDLIYTKSKDFISSKKAITGVGVDGSLIEFTDILNVFNYNDNKNDYIFIATLEAPTNNTLKGLTPVACPNFSNGRMYVKILNNTGSAVLNLTDTYVNLLILKRNSYNS